MRGTFGALFKVLGMITVVLSIAMLPPVLVCVYYGENHAAAGLFHAIWVGFITGTALFLLFGISNGMRRSATDIYCSLPYGSELPYLVPFRIISRMY